ncbi:MAG: TIGR00159 family protein [Treponema sp.]|nr:TIGR00159 family protein [Treponema sp.]
MIFDQVLKIYDYISPLIDILVLSFVLYKGYEIIVKTQGSQIFKTLIVLGLAYSAAIFFKLSTMQWLLNMLAPSFLITFVIIFQPELRKIFLKLGQGGWHRLNKGTKHSVLDATLAAAEILAAQKRGMLVVFMRHSEMKDILNTGTTLNADVSSSLLVTIFAHDTPLHDGATIIQDSKILSSGCFLPLSEHYDIKKTFGTRHRAALGLSEETDAVILIVSEESGAISLAYDSQLHYDLTLDETTKTLETLLDISGNDSDFEGNND